MKEIILKSPTYGDKKVKLDDEDYEWAKQFTWSLKKIGRLFYARRSTTMPTWTLMHREIMKITDRKDHIDHKDGDGLNNQKDNLRRANPSQNSANRRKKENSSSMYRGVCYRPKRKKYQAGIQINNKWKYLGHFDDEIQAAKAYDIAAQKHHGEFANLNFK